MGVSLNHLFIFFAVVYFSQAVHGTRFPLNLFSKSGDVPHPVIGESKSNYISAKS
jgi:hypothetical protein